MGFRGIPAFGMARDNGSVGFPPQTAQIRANKGQDAFLGSINATKDPVASNPRLGRRFSPRIWRPRLYIRACVGKPDTRS